MQRGSCPLKPAVVKGFQCSTDEEGQLKINALLHGSCQDTETASASSVRTNGLSAFTWSLVAVIGERGMDLSSLELHEAAKEKLKTGGVPSNSPKNGVWGRWNETSS
jgi:hypothetical protein